MRACGVNLWSVARPPIVIAIALGCLCIYINNTVQPASYTMRRTLMQQIKVDPLNFFEVGTFIKQFPGVLFRIGQRDGNQIRDVIIYDLRDPTIRRELRARSGEIRVVGDGQAVQLILYDVRVDPLLEAGSGAGFMRKYLMPPLDLSSRSGGESKTRKDMTMAELVERGWGAGRGAPVDGEVDLSDGELSVTDVQRERMTYKVELSKRGVLSVFCLTFVLVGIPLGIRRHRRESTIGIAMSLLIVLVCYVFITMAESLASRPETQPHILIWLPCVVTAFVGIVLMRRSN
jgi:lipopolysaccharide export system permease protein